MLDDAVCVKGGSGSQDLLGSHAECRVTNYHQLLDGDRAVQRFKNTESLKSDWQQGVLFFCYKGDIGC